MLQATLVKINLSLNSNFNRSSTKTHCTIAS